jgi:hypothetical protein
MSDTENLRYAVGALTETVQALQRLLDPAYGGAGYDLMEELRKYNEEKAKRPVDSECSGAPECNCYHCHEVRKDERTQIGQQLDEGSRDMYMAGHFVEAAGLAAGGRFVRRGKL